MSRTYRFRKGKFIPWWNDYSWKEWVNIREEDIDPTWEVRLNERSRIFKYARKLTGKELKKVKAFQYQDRTFSCKEPGPHWFRNLYTDRPQRREAKRQLKKFLLDTDFEVIINPKDPLEYWT